MMGHVENQSASHTKPYCCGSQPQKAYVSQAPGLGSPVPKDDVMLQGYWSYLVTILVASALFITTPNPQFLHRACT